MYWRSLDQSTSMTASVAGVRKRRSAIWASARKSSLSKCLRMGNRATSARDPGSAGKNVDDIVAPVQKSQPPLIHRGVTGQHE